MKPTRLRTNLALLLLLPAGVASCAPRPAESPSPNLPATIRVVATHLEDVSRPIPDEYARTHGQTARGIAAPYVEEFARVNGVDLERLTSALFPKGVADPPPADSSEALITSLEHVTGAWTYCRSATVRFYQLKKVRIAADPESHLLLLYARATPRHMIPEKSPVEWRLALLTERYEPRADQGLPARLPGPEAGVWDTIYTGLRIRPQSIEVTIDYVHSGGGGGRDQEFSYTIQLCADPLRLILLSTHLKSAPE